MKTLARPERYTSYEADSALLNTPAKKLGVAAIVAVAFLVPFMFQDDRIAILSDACVFAIAAIGLNLVTGYAGQVSLGHAFFFGVGAFTAAVLGGAPGGSTLGYGLDMVIWLPAAGLVAAAAGLLISPAAVRLRGLYLAIVTLGLVFLGEHIFREAKPITGGVGVGRPAALPKLFGYRFDQPGLFGLEFSAIQKTYLLMLVFLILAAILGRNVARSAVG
ncbi:MAG: branched-chain amino acid ABC transporter permease, partial [Acidimicrobiia bacterium]